MKNNKYTQELLSEVVSKSTNFSEVLRALEIPQSGGMHSYIKKRIGSFSIDTSHFHRYKQPPAAPKKSWQELLVCREQGANRAKAHMLRRALTDSGVLAVCASCGLTDSWNGQPLVLEVDHINNVHWDDRKENLRFLCPNCHSQRPTHRST